MFECLTLRCSSFISSLTAVEWAQNRFGLRAGGAEVGRTSSADVELPSKEASTFHAAAANSNRRRWSICSGLFSAAEWSVFGALFGATLPLETFRRCSESFCVHSIVQTSCQSSSEWSINQWPSRHPQLHQRFSFSRECVHMLSRVTVKASIGCQECRRTAKGSLTSYYQKRSGLNPLSVRRWLITTRDAC